MGCEHRTEEEYAVCNRCRAFARIARDARLLLQARRVYLDNLLAPSVDPDAAQETMQKRIRSLEESVKFADDANLWD